MKRKEAIKEIRYKIKEQGNGWAQLPIQTEWRITASCHPLKWKRSSLLSLSWTERIDGSYIYGEVKILFNLIVGISLKQSPKRHGRELLLKNKNLRKQFVDSRLVLFGERLKKEREDREEQNQKEFLETSENLENYVKSSLQEKELE